MKTCPYCGRENDNIRDRCQECGNELAATAQPPVPDSQAADRSSKDSTGFVFLGVGITLMVLSIGASASGASALALVMFLTGAGFMAMGVIKFVRWRSHRREIEEPARINQVPSVWPTIVVAASLFFFDSYFLNQGVLSLFVLVLGTPILLLRVWLARKHPGLRKRRFLSVAIYASAALFVLVSIQHDAKVARQQAAMVVEACEKFQAQKGAYPATLSDLVPSFLDKIPRAKSHGTFREFFYYGGDGQHVLEYVSLPPFGKIYYVFEERKWGFRD